MKFIFLAIGVILWVDTQAQKLVLKQKLKIGINDRANNDFEVKYLDPHFDFKTERQNETFDQTSNLVVTYQNVKKPDWTKAKKLDKNNGDPNLPAIFKKDKVFIADIKSEDGRLYIYFWPFTEQGNKESNGTSNEVDEVNKFINKYSFSIELPKWTNLSFISSAWHAGVLTIPIKIYLGAADSVSAVQSAINTGLYFGRRWGRTKYVNLPNQKEFTTYQTSWSLNAFAGLTKIDIDDKNTSDKGKLFKGSVAAFSFGAMGGYHYKNFALFISYGTDKPFGKKADTWLLRKKSWIGIGFGYDIF